MNEENFTFREQFSPSTILSMRGRGGGIYMRGGGGGPGRRVLKLGVGGFTVRHSKSGGAGINNRSQSFGGSSTGFSPHLEDEGSPLQNEDDKCNNIVSSNSNNIGMIGGKPRIRRPRKSRKPQLEDDYPANIQVF